MERFPHTSRIFHMERASHMERSSLTYDGDSDLNAIRPVSSPRQGVGKRAEWVGALCAQSTSFAKRIPATYVRESRP